MYEPTCCCFSIKIGLIVLFVFNILFAIFFMTVFRLYVVALALIGNLVSIGLVWFRVRHGMATYIAFQQACIIGTAIVWGLFDFKKAAYDLCTESNRPAEISLEQCVADPNTVALFHIYHAAWLAINIGFTIAGGYYYRIYVTKT